MNDEKIGEFLVLGLMSGTSLDGLDLALCKFNQTKTGWSGNIIDAETKVYPHELMLRLSNAMKASGEELAHLDNDLGTFMGELSRDFLESIHSHPICIASHGHTVFHQPQHKMTLQIGNPAALAVKSGIRTIADFRRTDVALGGQGAPLVPFGDALLFSDFDYCLNLGGIANITDVHSDPIRAFDICPANMALNYLIGEKGLAFDDRGGLAASGKANIVLLDELNALDYYHLTGPKSLGREWFDSTFLPLIQNQDINLEDRLCTCVEHIAQQIAQVVDSPDKSVLVTGGGALNDFLIERIKSVSKSKIVKPEKKLIEFKEAYVFAFLGLMRYLELENTWSSITGAARSSCGGAIYLP